MVSLLAPKRCGATAGRQVPTRAVIPTEAGKMQDAKEQDQDEGDDPEYLYPTWGTVGRKVSHMLSS